jgi:hypothetical protein
MTWKRCSIVNGPSERCALGPPKRENPYLKFEYDVLGDYAGVCPFGPDRTQVSGEKTANSFNRR